MDTYWVILWSKVSRWLCLCECPLIQNQWTWLIQILNSKFNLSREIEKILVNHTRFIKYSRKFTFHLKNWFRNLITVHLPGAYASLWEKWCSYTTGKIQGADGQRSSAHAIWPSHRLCWLPPSAHCRRESSCRGR
jgi:hypothetical protein